MMTRHVAVCVALAACAWLVPTLARAQAEEPSRLIADLRSDDVEWNAIHAYRILYSSADPPLAELESALESDDWQQRQLAAAVLWYHYDPPEWRRARGAAPRGHLTARLMEVTVEGLRSDDLPIERATGRCVTIFNAREGFSRIRRHPKLAIEALANGLESEDRQQQLLCALLLGFAGAEAHADRAVPILLPHLRDNEIPEDAKWAAPALYRFGPVALPQLEGALADADDQQRALLKLIIDHLRANGQQGVVEVAGRNTITALVADPVLQPPWVTATYWLYELEHDGSP